MNLIAHRGAEPALYAQNGILAAAIKKYFEEG